MIQTPQHAVVSPDNPTATSVTRLIPIAAALALSFAGPTLAATIAVNTATAAGASGSCTIVAAATSINQASLVAGCTNSGGAFGSGDKIDLSGFALPTTIVFLTGMPMANDSALVLTKPATLHGKLDSNGKPMVTITRTNEGPLNVRLIDTTANLTLFGLTLFNGRPAGDGGALRGGSNANLTLINSLVYGNFSGGNGGGIHAQAAVTLTNTSVDDNFASGSGGGVNVAGTQGSVTATGSTISRNTSDGTGNGGGINAKTVTLTNSTISGNTSASNGGGIYAQNATLAYCTIAENTLSGVGLGAGLAVGPLPASAFTATATVLTDNAPGNDIDSAVDQTLGGGHNLASIYSRNISVPADTVACDAKLDLLADNGGPTETQALAPGSCAIDAGPTSAPGAIPSDQRGNLFERRFGSATDIGAYESQTNDRIFYSGFES
ncbi:MAG: choice-of-anchor Q domain-containing protein [Dokdonella sp.]